MPFSLEGEEGERGAVAMRKACGDAADMIK